MILKFWRKKVRLDVETARRRREEAERQLAVDREEVIVPLREMLRHNHITADIADIILSTYRGGRGDANPSSC